MNTVRWAPLGIALCAAVGCGTQGPAGPFAAVPDTVSASHTIAFVDVNVVPMDAERVLAHQTVVVRDGKIATIGDMSAVTPPESATVIEGDGRYLMPGLADMHMHLLNDDHLLLYLANGITTVRNMWGHPTILEWQHEIAAGEKLGPRVYTASRGLDGNEPYWPTSIIVTTPSQAVAAVAQEVANGYQFIKVYNSLAPDVYDAIAKAAHSDGVDFVGHVPWAVPVSRALADGQRSIEHLTGYAPTVIGNGVRNWFGDLNHDQAVAIARATAAAGTWNCPTLVVLSHFVNAQETTQLEARPEMRYVDPDTKASWQVKTNASPSETAHADAMRGQFVRILHDNGAPLIAGTDSPLQYTIPGFSLHTELGLLVHDGGLTPYQALRAATADAAIFMRAQHEWGTVKEGLSADLILLDANPLDDVANAAKLSGVMVRGAWYSSADLQRRLDALARRYERGGAGPTEPAM